MSALSQQLLLASLFCIFHSLSLCRVSHWGSTQLKEASNTVRASFAMNNKWAFLPSHLLSGSHAWIKLWHQSLWPLADPQSLLLATTLLPLLVWSRSHVQHGQWNDPQGTSFWFLDPKESFIFTSKTSTSVIGLGHWFESERSVPASKAPYPLAKRSENRYQKEWGAKVATPDAVLLAPKHGPSPERNSLINGCP